MKTSVDLSEVTPVCATGGQFNQRGAERGWSTGSSLQRPDYSSGRGGSGRRGQVCVIHPPRLSLPWPSVALSLSLSRLLLLWSGIVTAMTSSCPSAPLISLTVFLSLLMPVFLLFIYFYKKAHFFNTLTNQSTTKWTLNQPSFLLRLFAMTPWWSMYDRICTVGERAAAITAQSHVVTYSHVFNMMNAMLFLTHPSERLFRWVYSSKSELLKHQ